MEKRGPLRTVKIKIAGTVRIIKIGSLENGDELHRHFEKRKTAQG